MRESSCCANLSGLGLLRVLASSAICRRRHARRCRSRRIRPLLQHAGNSGCRRARDRRRHEVTFAPYPAHTTGRTRHARPAGSTCQCCFGAAPALRAATAGTVYNIHTASGHISDQIRPPIAHRQKLKNGRPSPGQLQQAPSRCHLSLHPSATPAPPQRRNHIEEKPSEQDPANTGGACTQRAHN